LALLRKGV